MNTPSFRRSTSFFTCTLLTLFLAAACEKDTGPETEIEPMGEVFGTLFDATTGERLSGEEIELYLIGGGDVFDPNALDTVAASPFSGDYVFNDVPIASAVDVYTYKMMALNAGFQRFEGYFDFAKRGSTDFHISLIKNIYLFPTGASAGDIIIYVERDRERVPGAEVILQQNIQGNSATAETNANYRLLASPGLLPRLTATTGTDGMASFSGSNLVLGGAYTPTVLPTSYEGTRLALATGAQIIVGDASTSLVQLITMEDEEPGDNPEALYIVYASNWDPADITGDGTGAGVLTIVFNRPIETYREQNYHAFLTGAGRAVLDDTTGNEVNGLTSSDGYTLILRPNWTIAPVPLPEDAGLRITYTGVQVTLLDDDPFAIYDLFSDLTYLDGIRQVSGTVAIIDPNL